MATVCSTTCEYLTIADALAAGQHEIQLNEPLHEEPGQITIPPGAAISVVAGLLGGVSVTSRSQDPMFVVPVGASLSTHDVSAVRVIGRVFLVQGGTLDVYGGVFYSLGLVDGGGVLRADGGSVTLRNARLLDSVSISDGGLVAIESATFLAEDTIFRGGFARRGGAVWVSGVQSAVFRRCTFDGNEAATDGGGLAFDAQGEVLVEDSLFSANLAGDGGGLAATEVSSAVDFRIVRTEIRENRATGSGGGFHGVQRSGSLEQVTFVGNEAGTNGGAISFRGALRLDDALICDNSARGSGGGVYLSGAPVPAPEWSHLRVVRNFAALGGGLAAGPEGAVKVRFSSLLANHAEGGAAFDGSTTLRTVPLTAFASFVALSEGAAAIQLPLVASLDDRETLYFGNRSGDVSGPLLGDRWVDDPRLLAFDESAPCDALDERYDLRSPLVDQIAGIHDPDGSDADLGAWGGRSSPTAPMWVYGDADPVPFLYDCDDDDPSVYPIRSGEPTHDLPYDGTDADCDGSDDFDFDGDGYDTVEPDTDCDDTDPQVHPGAVDQPGRNLNCDQRIDADGDGFGADEDCDDLDPARYPGAVEDRSAVDRDCDGLSDPAGELRGVGCATAPGTLGLTGFVGLTALVALRRRR